jgi:hypothetical protein
VMAPRAARKGLISECREADHRGELASFRGINKAPPTGAKRWHRGAKWVCCAPKTLRRPEDTTFRAGAGPEYREKQL